MAEQDPKPKGSGATKVATKVAKADPEVAAASAAAGRVGKRRAAGDGAGAGGPSEQGGEQGGGSGDKGGVSRETSRSRTGGGPSFKGSAPRKLLVTEFVVCVLVLALAPLSGKHGADDVHAWIRRWFGITGLFLMLGLAATAGDKVGRIAAASGLIVTAALVFNDADVFTNLLAHIASTPKASTTQGGGPT